MSFFFPKHFSRSKHFYKKFLVSVTLFSVLLVSPGCNVKSHPKDVSFSAEAVSFTSFLDEFFRDCVASDSLSLHYTVHNPEALGLKLPPVSLGQFSEESLRLANQSAEDYLSRLHTFSKDTLNESGRFSYDLLEYALENSILPEGTLLYDSPLGPSTGLQTQLPVLLAEYRFSSIEDVETYFLLLEDLPNYFTQLCTFEQARSAAGTQSCAEVLSRITLQCNSFTEDPGNNFLIESFRDRLSAIPGLSAAQTAELCVRNQKLVFTKVIPAYEQLTETLKALLDPSVPAQGLSAFPEGDAYYESLVRSTTGSDKTIEELESMLQQALKENLRTLLTLSASETLQEELKQYQKQGLSVKDTTDSTPVLSDDTDDRTTSAHSSRLLQQLQEELRDEFPTPADASFRVETVHPSLEDFISPAFYLVPPFDSYKENVIYINRAKCSSEALFSTLAHEGYPGHLYQNTYFASTSPHPVRMLLNFTGYDEGWGTYAELFSYQYADCSEELRKLLIADQVAGLCLYSLSDIKIHYHGEDLPAVTAYLTGYGFSPESAEEIYYTLLAEPAVYLPYSVGYLEFCNLREQYLTLQGKDASLLPFHTFLLETGPAPFSLLEERLLTEFQ